MRPTQVSLKHTHARMYTCGYQFIIQALQVGDVSPLVKLSKISVVCQSISQASQIGVVSTLVWPYFLCFCLRAAGKWRAETVVENGLKGFRTIQ